MARRKRLANPPLDSAVIKGCVPNVALVAHDLAFREPLPFRPIEFAVVCSRWRWGDRAAARLE